MNNAIRNDVLGMVSEMRGVTKAAAAVPAVPAAPVQGDPAIAYAYGICKAAETVGISPEVVADNMIAKTAMEKRARNFAKLLGKLGLWGLAGYGGIRGGTDLYNKFKEPEVVAPPPEPSILEKIKGFVSEHPYATTAAAVGIPLAAYLAYKAFSNDDDRKGYAY